MEKAATTAVMESAIADILYRKRDMSLHDFARYTDFMISAYRAALLRRMEREPLAYSISMFRDVSVEDPGLVAVNRSLQQIADSVGYKPSRDHQRVPEGFFDPRNLGPSEPLRCSTCGHRGAHSGGVCSNQACESRRS